MNMVHGPVIKVMDGVTDTCEETEAVKETNWLFKASGSHSLAMTLQENQENQENQETKVVKLEW